MSTLSPGPDGDREVELFEARARKRLEADVDVLRLSNGFDQPLAASHPLWPLMQDVARALTAAGLHIHDCVGRAPGGGVCLTPLSGDQGISVSWTQHDAAEAELGYDVYRDLQDLMNPVLADALTVLGFRPEPFGTGGAYRVVGRLTRPSDEATDDPEQD